MVTSIDEMVSLKDLLEFFIKREETSAVFFSSVAVRTCDPQIKQTFRALMQQCVDRKLLLIRLQLVESRSETRTDIPLEPIREYLVDVSPRSEMSDMQALAFSSLRSETSEKLYERILSVISKPVLRESFEKFHSDHLINKQLCNCMYDQLLEIEA